MLGLPRGASTFYMAVLDGCPQFNSSTAYSWGQVCGRRQSAVALRPEREKRKEELRVGGDLGHFFVGAPLVDPAPLPDCWRVLCHRPCWCPREATCGAGGTPFGASLGPDPTDLCLLHQEDTCQLAGCPEADRKGCPPWELVTKGPSCGCHLLPESRCVL